MIELFAGAGGLSLGFHQTGLYDLIALNDIEPSAKATYEANFPKASYLCKDVAALTKPEMLRLADGRKIHGILGGPPCQGFSLAGRKDQEDERNRYVEIYAQFVLEIQPDFLVMENVPQVIHHARFANLRLALEKDYRLVFEPLNAALYGVPQTRHRAILIAYRRDLEVEPTLPEPTHWIGDQAIFNYVDQHLEKADDAQRKAPLILGADSVSRRMWRRAQADADGRQFSNLVTVADALSDLSGLASGETLNCYSHEAQTDYQWGMRQGADELHNHRVRRHAAPLLDLIAGIREGGDLRDVDPIRHPKSHYSQAYGRLHRDGLARTITTYFCNAGSGRFLHPTDHRTLTVREAARLQGFPDWYRFVGTQAEQMRLVGNAVPPPLAEAVARQIAAQLSEI